MTDPRGVSETRLAIESHRAPAPGSPTRSGRVLLVLDTIDPLAAMRALAAPATPEAATVARDRATRVE